MGLLKADVVVIGGGAAGSMCALTAAQRGLHVVLLEPNKMLGKKLRITGKGRCNVTNHCDVKTILANIPGDGRFLYSALNRLGPQDTMALFESLGVPLKTERGNRVFPVSDRSHDVANALERAYAHAGGRVVHAAATDILTQDGAVSAVVTTEGTIDCDAAVICTGGLSYPLTGSTGDGYVFAADTGHAVEPVRPSLTPLVSSCLWIKNMNGLLLRNVRATLCIDGEAVREEFGELGFSERGIEGAVALRMSRDAVDALIDGKGVGLMVDLKPGLTEEMLRERIAREMAEMGPEEFFSELLRKLVPKALVIPLSEEVGAHSKNYIRKITPEQIERLVKLLKGMVFPISDYAPFEYAVVTAGGVSCEDVNRYTMESLKVKGLYFAGEVLDLDANTGGYNLQIAFSTGRLAGMLKQ